MALSNIYGQQSVKRSMMRESIGDSFFLGESSDRLRHSLRHGLSKTGRLRLRLKS